MTINLYTVNKDPRSIDKLTTATLISSGISIEPTEGINTLSPIFRIDYSDAYLGANYLYCDTFDRYYYVSPPRVITGHRIELPCSVDVRQSFQSAILNSSGVIIRAQAKDQPTQIVDDKLPINPNRKKICSIILPETSGTFDTDAEYSYLLTVVGGTPNVTP